MMERRKWTCLTCFLWRPYRLRSLAFLFWLWPGFLLSHWRLRARLRVAASWCLKKKKEKEKSGHEREDPPRKLKLIKALNFSILSLFQKLINNSWAYYPLRRQKLVTCIHLYSRYRMIILKSPKMVLISVSWEIGVEYINNEIITEIFLKIWLPRSLYKDDWRSLYKDHVNCNAKLSCKRQYRKTLTTVNKKVSFPDKFLLEQKFVILQFPMVHKIVQFLKTQLSNVVWFDLTWLVSVTFRMGISLKLHRSLHIPNHSILRITFTIFSLYITIVIIFPDDWWT